MTFCKNNSQFPLHEAAPIIETISLTAGQMALFERTYICDGVETITREACMSDICLLVDGCKGKAGTNLMGSGQILISGCTVYNVTIIN